MKVLLLGAGASKSYSGSPSGLRMPIANDFFQTYNKSWLSEHSWVLVGKILCYLRDEKGVSDWNAWFDKGYDMESLFSEIADHFIDATDTYEKVLRVGPYNELIFLFASVLNEIANGPVSKPHLDLASSLGPNDTVITFNWDTLMDRALFEKGGWNLEDGYGVMPHSIFSDEWKKCESQATNQSAKLLKLHGSTNWLTGHPIFQENEVVSTQDLPNSTLFIFEKATTPYSTFAGRYFEGYEPFTCGYYPPNLTHIPGRRAKDGHEYVSARLNGPWMPESEIDSSGIPSIPLMIPPIKEKNYSFFGDLFDQIWAQAETSLAECDEILIIGYSFPPTDRRSIDLFKKAFSQRNSMPKVSIIDPAPRRAVETFQFELGIPLDQITILEECFEGAESLNRLKANG